MDATNIIVAVSLIVAVIGLAAYNLSISAELRHARQETSRFPLFAARTALVQLVAEGRMSESDPAWRGAYREVNNLLGMHQKLHVWDFAYRYVKHLYRLEMDKDLKAHFEKVQAMRQRAAERVPEFGRVQDEVVRGIMYAMKQRSTKVHYAMLYMLMALLSFLLIAVRAGTSATRVTANVAKTAFRSPSPEQVQSLVCC